MAFWHRSLVNFADFLMTFKCYVAPKLHYSECLSIQRFPYFASAFHHPYQTKVPAVAAHIVHIRHSGSILRCAG